VNALAHVRAACPALKVFPLPNVVLFPGNVQPLHIFEPRYRDMLEAALRTDKVIAVAQLRAGWEPDYEGRPPLKPIACAGVLEWHERMPDGRYNVLLRGVTRIRLLEELPPTHRYREVRCEALPDAEYRGPEEELLRAAALELSSRVPQEATMELLQSVARTAGGGLADAIAAMTVEDAEERQRLLEELDVKVRMREVLDGVSELIARVSAARPEGPLN